MFSTLRPVRKEQKKLADHMFGYVAQNNGHVTIENFCLEAIKQSKRENNRYQQYKQNEIKRANERAVIKIAKNLLNRKAFRDKMVIIVYQNHLQLFLVCAMDKIDMRAYLRILQIKANKKQMEIKHWCTVFNDELRRRNESVITLEDLV